MLSSLQAPAHLVWRLRRMQDGGSEWGQLKHFSEGQLKCMVQHATLRTKYSSLLSSHYEKLCSFGFPTSYMKVNLEEN